MLATVGAVLLPTLASAQAGPVTNLSARTDVMKAGGNASGSDGFTPAPFALTAGASRVLQVTNVTGDIGCAGATGFTADGISGPGGGPCFAQANVFSAGNVSGIQLDGRSIALIGVFLGPSLPGSAPLRLTYGADPGDLSYSALSYGGLQLGQTFYIGDGLTGTGSGSVQSFLVPDAATAVYFGFVDAPGYNGNPGAFGDNLGALSFNVNVAASTVPEPSTYALLATGLATIAGMARRRRTR